MKANEAPKKKPYVRPVMRTIVKPKEIRDIDQPCAFYRPGEKRRPPK